MGSYGFCSRGLVFSEAGLFVIGFGWGKLLFRGSMRRLLFLRCGVCTLGIQTHCQDPVWMVPQKNFLRRVWLLGVSNSHLQTPGMTGGFWRSTVYMCGWSRFEGFFFAAPPTHTPDAFLAASKERFTQSAWHLICNNSSVSCFTLGRSAWQSFT